MGTDLDDTTFIKCCPVFSENLREFIRKSQKMAINIYKLTKFGNEKCNCSFFLSEIKSRY